MIYHPTHPGGFFLRFNGGVGGLGIGYWVLAASDV